MSSSSQENIKVKNCEETYNTKSDYVCLRQIKSLQEHTVDSGQWPHPGEQKGVLSAGNERAGLKK